MSDRLVYPSLPSGYCFRQGSGLDRALLVKFMQRTYTELSDASGQSHLAETVEQYFSRETPLWWVDADSPQAPTSLPSSSKTQHTVPVACLWLGTAVDQVKGDRHAHIFLLYVNPADRRQGIGSALLHHAEAWARQNCDRQISLQVFRTNDPAINLYRSLGYEVQSLGMVKRL